MNSMDAHKKFLKELKSGTVALVLLGILEDSSEPMYGYQITKELDSDLLDIKQSALYPVLRSLERSGLLASDIEPSASGPPEPRRTWAIALASCCCPCLWMSPDLSTASEN